MSIFRPTPQERLARVKADLAKHRTAVERLDDQLASTSNETAWSKIDLKRRYHAAQVTRLEREVPAGEEAVEAKRVADVEAKRAADVATIRARVDERRSVMSHAITTSIKAFEELRQATDTLDIQGGLDGADCDRLRALGEDAQPFDLLGHFTTGILQANRDAALVHPFWHIREFYDGAGIQRQRAAFAKQGLAGLVAGVFATAPASAAARQDQLRRLAHVDGQAPVVALPAPKIDPEPTPLYEVELRAAGESTKYIAGVELHFDDYIGGGHHVALLRGGRAVPEGAEVVSIDRAELDGAVIEISTTDDRLNFVTQIDRPVLVRTPAGTFRVAPPADDAAA